MNMGTKAKLSIITVCYNDKKGLTRTIESVKRQTFKDYEYIIIDGGSTDGSYDVIQENLDHIDYWVSEKDNGIYNAMNKGVAVAKGEYCFMLNSDDILASPNTLEKIFHHNPSADIVYGNLAIMKKGRLKKVNKYPSRLNAYSFYRTQSSIHQQASFTKRTVFDKVGLFKENYKINADWVFFFESIIVNNLSYKYYNLVISIFSSEGISSNKSSDLGEKTRKDKMSILQLNLAEDQLKMLENMRRSKETKNKILINKAVAKINLYLAIINKEIDV
jgi:glycosyltransferase involved in cell wall biosynthesis